VDAIGGEPLKLQFGFTNVLFTLRLGTCACFAYDEMRKRNKEWAGLLAVVLCAGSAWILNTDYHIYGVLAVFACFDLHSGLTYNPFLFIDFFTKKGLYYIRKYSG